MPKTLIPYQDSWQALKKKSYALPHVAEDGGTDVMGADLVNIGSSASAAVAPTSTVAAAIAAEKRNPFMKPPLPRNSGFLPLYPLHYSATLCLLVHNELVNRGQTP